MHCGSALCRVILAKKKLLSIIGLIYVVITLAAYNKQLWGIVTSGVSLHPYVGNISTGNFWNDHANSSNLVENNSIITRFNGNLKVESHFNDDNLGHTSEGNFWNDHANSSNYVKNNSNITRFDGNVTVDSHFEDDNLGHTGEVVGEYSGISPYFVNHDFHNCTVIAIGTAITSKGTSGISEQNIVSRLQVFTTFLPSFCSTVSSGYNFQFYFAYDKTDPVFTNPSLLQAFQKAFSSLLEKQCPKDMEAGIHFVQCSHTGKPTWAQNDAMLEAYLDNVDYFYRINDDTNLQTKGWVEEFVKTLKGYDPPNVGVVGPNHSGGNTGILTYDFVHKTHVDIFGFYYPKLFTDWWGDDWVTRVYQPGRSTKLQHIRLAHTMKLGKRYRTDYSVGGRLQGRLQVDKNTLKR